jgi:ferredoxin
MTFKVSARIDVTASSEEKSSQVPSRGGPACEIDMPKYKLIVKKTQCVGCGVSVGHCPTHAKTLSRLLNQNRKEAHVEVFSEDIIDQVRQLVKACPVKALIIKKIE